MSKWFDLFRQRRPRAQLIQYGSFCFFKSSVSGDLRQSVFVWWAFRQRARLKRWQLSGREACSGRGRVLKREGLQLKKNKLNKQFWVSLKSKHVLCLRFVFSSLSGVDMFTRQWEVQSLFTEMIYVSSVTLQFAPYYIYARIFSSCIFLEMRSPQSTMVLSPTGWLKDTFLKVTESNT